MTIHEEYGETGGPIHMKVFGAGGVVMEGSAEDIVKRLELLGVTPPLNPALAAEASERQPSATSDGTAVATLDLEPATLEPQPSQAVSAGEALAETFDAIGPEGLQSEPTSAESISAKLDQEIKQTEDEEMEMSEAEEEKESAACERDYEMELEAAAGGEEDEVEDETDNEEDPELNYKILGERLIRLLSQPAYSENPPLEMTQFIGAIPHLASTQEAADFIKHLDDNIRLDKMKADAARRAKNLKYLKKANRAKRCRHVKFNGMSCGAPALRRQQFCQFHAPTHANSLEIPVIEDQQSLLAAHIRLAQQVAANKIDAAQAKVLLQIIDSAGRNLAKKTREYWEQVPTLGLGEIVG